MNATRELLAMLDAAMAFKAVSNGHRFRDGRSQYATELADHFDPLIDYAQERSPRGGVQIAGRYFPGGQWIPASVVAQATPEVKAKLEGDQKAATDKRRSRGSVDTDSLRESVKTHGHHELSKDEMRSAKAAFQSLHRHHEDLTVHRLEELIHDTRKAIDAVPDDHPNVDGIREQFGKRLKAYDHMLDMAHEKGVSGQMEGMAVGKYLPEAKTKKERKDLQRRGMVSETVRNMPTGEIMVDPNRFQFKISTTDKAAGVTDELKGVRTFDPVQAGIVLVWKDPADDKTYIVNGHHRHELASRLNYPELLVRYIDAPDAKAARAIGARMNIGEGRGTAVDAAKFMRDTGTTPDDLEKVGISLKGKVAADAIALSRLSDKLFDQVAQGRFDEGKAIAVAKHLDKPELQDKLFSLLRKREESGKDISNRVIESMALEMAMTPTTTKTEQTLWGDIESEESLFVERNEVKASVRNDLAREVNDWLAVSSKRRAERIGKAGNVLDVEENRRIAEEAERSKNVFDTLVNRKGPISDAINEAAAEYAKAKTKGEKDAIRKKAVEVVNPAILREIDGGGTGTGSQGDGAVAPVEPGRPDPGAGDTGTGDNPPTGLAPPALPEPSPAPPAPSTDPASLAALKPENSAPNKKIQVANYLPIHREEPPYHAAGWPSMDRAAKDQSIPVQQIDPWKLIAGQNTVDSETLASIKGDINNPILLVKHNGKLYIEDGTHRAISAIRDGKKVPARVIETDELGRYKSVNGDEATNLASLKSAWSAALMASTDPGLSDAERKRRKGEVDRLKAEWKAAEAGLSASVQAVKPEKVTVDELAKRKAADAAAKDAFDTQKKKFRTATGESVEMTESEWKAYTKLRPKIPATLPGNTPEERKEASDQIDRDDAAAVASALGKSAASPIEKQLQADIAASKKKMEGLLNHEPPEKTAGSSEPWQQTRNDHNLAWVQPDNQNPKGGYTIPEEGGSKWFKDRESASKFVDKEHRDWVKHAIKEGLPVPPEVLADYPDLAVAAPSPIEQQLLADRAAFKLPSHAKISSQVVPAKGDEPAKQVVRIDMEKQSAGSDFQPSFEEQRRLHDMGFKQQESGLKSRSPVRTGIWQGEFPIGPNGVAELPAAPEPPAKPAPAPVVSHRDKYRQRPPAATLDAAGKKAVDAEYVKLKQEQAMLEKNAADSLAIANSPKRDDATKASHLARAASFQKAVSATVERKQALDDYMQGKIKPADKEMDATGATEMPPAIEPLEDEPEESLGLPASFDPDKIAHQHSYRRWQAAVSDEQVRYAREMFRATVGEYPPL